MASARSSVVVLCVCSLMLLLLAADVAVAATQADLPQPHAQVTGSTKQFYLRGEAVSMLAENGRISAEEGLDSLERRELSDYETDYSKPNCSGNCK